MQQCSTVKCGGGLWRYVKAVLSYGEALKGRKMMITSSRVWIEPWWLRCASIAGCTTLHDVHLYEAEPKLLGFKSQGLANMAWALAKLGHADT
eukprot:351697-Chlamydomonas_euryale.AAC.5